MRKIFSTLLLCLCAPLAHAQGVVNFGGVALTGTAIGAGVDFTSQTVPLSAAANVALQFTAPWTISYWFKGQLPSTGTLITSAAGASATGIYIGTVTTQGAFTLEALVFPGGANNCLAVRACVRGTMVQDGNWHLVTASLSASGVMSEYVDGYLWDQNPNSGTFTPGTNYWKVGIASSTFQLRDIRVYTSVLDTPAVRYLYNLGNVGLMPSAGPLTTGMAAHWQLNACSPTCPDTSGNGNDLGFNISAPTVAVTVPSAGAVLTGTTVTMTATCSDTVGCANVQMVVDGSPTGAVVTSAPYTITYDSTHIADGAHTVSCIGINALGIAGTCANVNVTSSNGVSATAAYFANSGSDAADCSISTPCKTIAKANTLTYISGTLNLNGGDNFTDTCLAFTGGVDVYSSHDQPLTVQSYGTGNATITSSCSNGTNRVAAIGLVNVKGMVIKNLILRGTPGNGTNCGVSISQSSNTNISDSITVENNDIGGFGSNSGQLSAGGFCADVWVQGFPGTVRGITGLQVLNNVIHGLSGTTSADDNGIAGFGSGPNIISPVYQGNEVYNIGGTAGWNIANGILIDGTSGALATFNYVHDNGSNTAACPGPVGIEAFADLTPLITFNEVAKQGGSGTGGCDNGGLDLDGSVSNGKLFYNYTHENLAYGWQFFISTAAGLTWGPNDIAWNISINDATTNGIPVNFTNATATAIARMYNNTVVNSRNNYLFGMVSTCVGHMLIANNAFVHTINSVFMAQIGFGGAISPCTSDVRFANNGWYNSGTASWRTGSAVYTSLAAWQASMPNGEPGAVLTNPLLTGPTTPVACGTTTGPQPCPAGIVLGGSSPYSNTGVDLTAAPYSIPSATTGSMDYYGNAIPTGVGTGWPIGASK